MEQYFTERRKHALFLARKLKEGIEDRELPETRIAKALGVKQQTLWNFLNDKIKEPRYEFLVRVEELLAEWEQEEINGSYILRSSANFDEALVLADA